MDEQILNTIKAKPGQMAKDIAAQLGVDKKIVNSVLYGQLGLTGTIEGHRER